MQTAGSWDGAGQNLQHHFGSWGVVAAADAEDLPYYAGEKGTENDFNDMVLMLRVERNVSNGGATLVLLGAALTGLAAMRRLTKRA